MSNLLPFLFATIRKRAIDPNSKRFFLPVVLSNADGSNSQGKLLPIEEERWSVGPVTGEAGDTITTSFCNNWATYLEKVQKTDLSNQYPIADPKTPYPTLTMEGRPKLTIDGLQNVFVAHNAVFTEVPGGYQIQTTVQLDYWDGSNGASYPMLTISGGYKLQQSLCLAAKGGAVCNGTASIDINGGGTVKLEVDGAFVDAVFTVTVKDGGSEGRHLEANVQSLKVRGQDTATTPALDIKKLQIDADVSPFLLNVWQTMAQRAIQSPDGTNGIFANLNTSLNGPGNLKSLSAQMTSQLASFFDGIFGKADGVVVAVQTAPTVNPVDGYIFDRCRFALNSVSSPLFLPQLLCSANSPSLNPLLIAKVDLPALSIFGRPWTNGLLTNVNFIGLTNVQAPPSSIAAGDDAILHFTGALGAWNPPPPISCSGGIPAPPAKATAAFSILPQPDTVTGTLDLTITEAMLVGSCRTAGADDSSLTLTFQSLKVTCSNPVSNMKIKLGIDSAFKDIINNAVNTENILQKILDELNAELANNLSQVSTQVTAYAREAILNGLS